MIKKNKKGMLLAEETLKTVIAVIAISFLVYFLVSLYFGNLDESRQKHAEETLNSISGIIDSGKENLTAITPSGWYLFGFTGEEKPNPCAGKNCLCICDKNFGINFWESQSEECGDDGRCLIIENLEAFEEIEILDSGEGLTNIIIKKVNDKIVVERA